MGANHAIERSPAPRCRAGSRSRSSMIPSDGVPSSLENAPACVHASAAESNDRSTISAAAAVRSGATCCSQ